MRLTIQVLQCNTVPRFCEKVFYILYVTHLCHVHIICLMNCDSYARLLLLVLWTIILSLHICEFFTLRLRRQPLPWKNRPRSRGLVTARLPDAQTRSRERGTVSKAHPTVKVGLHANTSMSTRISHVWAQTTQAQAQTRVPFPCAFACVVRVHTWLMFALVLASYL